MNQAVTDFRALIRQACCDNTNTEALILEMTVSELFYE